MQPVMPSILYQRSCMRKETCKAVSNLSIESIPYGVRLVWLYAKGMLRGTTLVELADPTLPPPKTKTCEYPEELQSNWHSYMALDSVSKITMKEGPVNYVN